MKILKGETYKNRLLLNYLSDLSNIRKSCNHLYQSAVKNDLIYFDYNPHLMEQLADYVITIMLRQYPKLDVPIHSRMRHFEVAGVDRLKILHAKLEADDFVKSAIELIIVSILLDAGAGSAWKYKDHLSGATLVRSEGLAAASFNLFMQGMFSSDPHNLYQADALGLQNIQEDFFAAGLQVSDKNELQGLTGRLGLLQQLSVCILQHDEYFHDGSDAPRLGNILDYWLSHVINDALSMEVIFHSLLEAFGDIWPGRYTLDDINLGDVWPHRLAQTDLNPRGFIPFHKLTQWLCYSLIEPLEFLGVHVVDVELLTALPEYRNGGLLTDIGVLTPKNSDMFALEHNVGSELIVEWRAMTIPLIDHLADIIRGKLNMNVSELSLAQVLQGGTWLAGRLIAQQHRVDGSPPFKISSDGTVM